MADPAERFFLIVRAPNGDVREVPLGRMAVVLGRDESADIRVDDKKVSRRHAAFKVVDGVPCVEDLESSNGVRLNGKLIEKRAKIDYGDLVRVGRFYVSLKDSVEDTSASVLDGEPRDLEERDLSGSEQAAPKGLGGAPRMPVLEGLDEPVAGQVFVLHRGENVVGRLEECDIPILDGSVSRQHARFVFSRERVTLSDLGSANGVFVNDVAIDVAELANGDLVRIGNVRFKLSLPSDVPGQDGPIETRAKVKKGGKKKRWGLFGSLILLLAAGVASGAVFWRIEGSRVLASGGMWAYARAAARGLSVPASGVSPGPVALEPARPPAPDAAVAAPVASTFTATAPYAPRGADGRPLHLPEVDESFDFDGFVGEKLALASDCEAKRDPACLRSVLDELAARDPVNGVARAMRDRMARIEAVRRTLEEANALGARGEFAKAFRLLLEVPEGLPEHAGARAQAEKLRKLAIEDELKLAERDLSSPGAWKRAHARFRYVLELEPGSEAALAGLREVEKKMRRRHLEFTPYQPGAGGRAEAGGAAAPEAITAHYAGDAELVAIAKAYARGDLARALKKAKKLEDHARGERAKKAKEMARSISKIEGQYERTRSEIANDPSQAWARLMQLERMEAQLLPKGIESFVVRELEVSLSEAFAGEGDSMFEEERFEEAFQRWEAGQKLDATNPKVLAGLKKLVERAGRDAEEAELAAQRGERDVCDQWKRITRMTPSDSDVHAKARSRAEQACR